MKPSLKIIEKESEPFEHLQCHTTAPSQFGTQAAGKNLKPIMQFLTNDNFYAQGQKAIEPTPTVNETRALTTYDPQRRSGPPYNQAGNSGWQRRPQQPTAQYQQRYQQPAQPQNAPQQPRTFNVAPEQMPAMRGENPPLKEVQKFERELHALQRPDHLDECQAATRLDCERIQRGQQPPASPTNTGQGAPQRREPQSNSKLTQPIRMTQWDKQALLMTMEVEPEEGEDHWNGLGTVRSKRKSREQQPDEVTESETDSEQDSEEETGASETDEESESEESASEADEELEAGLRKARKFFPKRVMSELRALLSCPRRRRHRATREQERTDEEASSSMATTSQEESELDDESDPETDDEEVHEYDHQQELADYYRLYPEKLHKTLRTRQPADSPSDRSDYTSDTSERPEDDRPSVLFSDAGLPTRDIYVKQRTDRLRHLWVQVGKKCYKGLLDNGSTSTFVSTRLVREQALRPVASPKPLSFAGLDSSPVGRADQEVRLILQMMSTKPERLVINTPAYIMKNLGADLVIGRNLLCSAGLNIDTNPGRPIRQGDGQTPNYLTDLNPTSEAPKRIERDNEDAYLTVPLGEGTVRIGRHLTDTQKSQLMEMLNDHIDCFATKSSELGCTNVIVHTIDTGDASRSACSRSQKLPFWVTASASTAFRRVKSMFARSSTCRRLKPNEKQCQFMACSLSSASSFKTSRRLWRRSPSSSSRRQPSSGERNNRRPLMNSNSRSRARRFSPITTCRERPSYEQMPQASDSAQCYSRSTITCFGQCATHPVNYKALNLITRSRTSRRWRS